MKRKSKMKSLLFKLAQKMFPNDPLYNCKFHLDNVCAHVDGMLCTFKKGQTDCSYEKTVEDFEDQLEKAYWKFDAKKRGYFPHRNHQVSEREAFKQEVRELIK